jgi:fatty-acyl-CoA synthase
MSTGSFIDQPIRRPGESRQFEPAMQLDQRLRERGVLDAFICAAQGQPARAAHTMLRTGAPDEQPRRVDCAHVDHRQATEVVCAPHGGLGHR